MQIIDHKNFTSHKAKLSIYGLSIMFYFLLFHTISRTAYGIDRFTNIDNTFISILHQAIPKGIMNWTFIVLLFINWYFHSSWFNSIYHTKQELDNSSLITDLNQVEINNYASIWFSWFIPFLNILAPSLILLEINIFFSKKFPLKSNQIKYYILAWTLLFVIWYSFEIKQLIIGPDYDFLYTTQTFGLELMTDFIQLISIIPMIIIIKKMTKLAEDYLKNGKSLDISEHLIDN